MKTFFTEIEREPSLARYFTKAEVIVIGGLCQVSAHLRFICYTFQIPHPSSRLGWVMDPIKVACSFDKDTTEKEAAKIIKKAVKEKLFLEHKNPHAILPNAEEFINRYNVRWHAYNIPDDAIFVQPTDSLSNQEFWDQIPGISDKLEPITLDQYVDKVKTVFDWAQEYSVLTNVPEYLIEVSKLITDVTGYRPEGKDWIASVLTLYKEAGSDMSILKAGLMRGNEMRKTITFTSIRSFTGAICEEMAQRKITNPIQAVQAIQTTPTKQPITVRL